MIFRLSQKLNARIKTDALRPLLLDDNPFADWSAQLFVADRTHYILVTNTKSLYSTVMFANGINTDGRFIHRALGSLREFMEADGLADVYQRLLAPASARVRFAKALDRSVTGSMNNLVELAGIWMTKQELSPFDVGFKLNGTPFSSLKYVFPREEFVVMANADKVPETE